MAAFARRLALRRAVSLQAAHHTQRAVPGYPIATRQQGHLKGTGKRPTDTVHDPFHCLTRVDADHMHDLSGKRNATTPPARNSPPVYAHSLFKPA
jgi:hypothetical protein